MPHKNYDYPTRIKILQKIEPFNLLTERQLYKIASFLEEEYYPAGTFIAKQGEDSRHILFFVVEGKVEVSVVDRSGRRIITGYRGPFELMGEAAFLSGENYPASAQAQEDTYCFVLPQEKFAAVITENPKFAAYFTRLLTERLRILYRRFSDEEELIGDRGLSKRIADIMVTQVVTCSPVDSVRHVATLMTAQNVSSIVVAEAEEPLGIITEGDLVSQILQAEDLQKSAARTAREIMNRDLVTIQPQEFSYQAFLQMVKYRVKHVIVISENGKLAGIVAMRDLIKSRKTGSLAIVQSIESSRSLKELCRLRTEVDQVMQALLAERATSQEITALMTEFYDRITRKVITLSEQSLVEEGHGLPPTAYCWITMGSSGRKEQYARTDQDNGIIYEDVPPSQEENVKKYFLLLGEKVVSGLEEYGFKRCPGKVMANNEDWCRSFQGWRVAIREWLADLRPQDVRLMTIFLDFRYLYGQVGLYNLLRNYVARNFRSSAAALNFLAQDTLSKRIPLNIFRKIQTERSGKHRHKLNLKTAGCVHIVDSIRIFALQEGLLVTNTFERLDEIGKKGILNDKDVGFIASAYDTLMTLRIREAMSKMRVGAEPDNYIDPRELSGRDYAQLREALIMVGHLQGLTGGIFQIAP